MDKEGITPEYPFGYGLSYTTFDYKNEKYQDLGDKIEATCDLTNTGEVTGEESVLVFVGSNIEGKPLKLLKGFKRVKLEPKEKKTVTVTIPKEDLRLYDKDKDEMVIPENITVYVGKNVLEVKQAKKVN